VVGQELESWGRDKEPDRDLEGFAPLTTFCENILFCHGFENNSDICIHYLQVFNMKNQIGGRKVVGQAKIPIGHKKWAAPCLLRSSANGHTADTSTPKKTNQIANMTIARQ